MQIEIGKFYKTRGGKKAYVFYGFKSCFAAQKYLVAVVNEKPYEVYQKGTYMLFPSNDKDLVREWAKCGRNRVKQRELILEMLKQGKTYKQIREKTGAAWSTIARARKVGGYKTAHYDKPKTVAKYKKLIEQGLTIREIAKRVHKSENAVTWYIYTNDELSALKKSLNKRKNK